MVQLYYTPRDQCVTLTEGSTLTCACMALFTLGYLTPLSGGPLSPYNRQCGLSLKQLHKLP
jgi:hypothetical protein